MEKRIELNWMLDFYGPLLTENRREIVRLYCEEDLTLSEIAEQEGISRQGVHDALSNAQKQLENYERMLGMLTHYRAIQAAVEECRRCLSNVTPAPGSEQDLHNAKQALTRIEWIER